MNLKKIWHRFSGIAGAILIYIVLPIGLYKLIREGNAGAAAFVAFLLGANLMIDIDRLIARKENRWTN